MADGIGNVPPVGVPVVPSAAPVQSFIELAHQPPPALLLAASLSAVVVGRGGNGALLLRTDYGTLALKTALTLAPGSRVDLKLLPGPPPAVMLLHIDEANTGTPSLVGGTSSSTAGKPAAGPPSAQLDLGTEIGATVVGAAPGEASGTLAVGTRLILRVALPLPDAAQTPSATSFSGTITANAADNPDKTIVETPLGSLALEKQLALPPGTVLGFERVATSSASAIPGQLALGTVIEAKVLSPAGDAFPTGTQLLLRVAALPVTGNPSADQATMTGTVLAGTAADTIIETPLGTLALARRLSLPPGASLDLQQLAATLPDQPTEAPVSQRAGWPALDQALSVLDRAAPDLAARLRSDLTPQSGQQLAGTLLFLMGALGNSTWPGGKAAIALDQAGRRDLRMRLDGDVGELRRLADPPSGDWQVYVLPLVDGGLVRPVRLYLRRHGSTAAPSEQGTRFVLDVDMSRLGAVQLDGLVRQQRFDLVLRSHRPIGAEMRQAITTLFRDSTSAVGLAGDVVFTTASRFAVAPLEALRRHVGVDA